MLSISNGAKYRATSITVVTGVLLSLWQLLIAPLAQSLQLFLFAASIFAFGIQHGALDHLIEAEIAKRKHMTFHILSFLGKYGVLMLVYAIVWYLFPQFSFLLFILMSALHFGETDITGNRMLTSMLIPVYGISVIAWILFSHAKNAGDIISGIVSPGGSVYRFWLSAANHSMAILLISGVIIMVVSLVSLTKKSGQDKFYNMGLLINLFLILGCCLILPLLLSFALYFAGWHSVITLYNIQAFTESDDNKIPVRKLWLKALPLSATAIAGLLLTGYLLQHQAPLFNPLPLLFVFLSLITLPHINIMHQLTKRLFG